MLELPSLGFGEVVLSVFYIVILLVSVSFHEFSHGRVSLAFGDSTALEQGRLTLNPIKHLDPLGSVILPLMLIVSNSGIVFGWAKPVPINPSLYSENSKRKAWILTSLAGPISNFLLALVFLVIFILVSLAQKSDIGVLIFLNILAYGFIINLILGMFNLLPFYPLDGFWILFNFLPSKLQEKLEEIVLSKYSFIVSIGMIIIAILIARGILPLVLEHVFKLLNMF